MTFEIRKIEGLSGKKANIYSVIFEGQKTTLLEQFFEKNAKEDVLIRKLLMKIIAMTNKTGCQRHFFKEGEGALGDGVIALAVGGLRLYGIYFNQSVVLLGGGGIKKVRVYQDDPILNKEAEKIKFVAKKINKAISDKIIRITDEGTLDDENFEVYE